MYNALVDTFGKIRKTKLMMLVALVILNIMTTISLYFMMTRSTLTTLGAAEVSDALVTFYGVTLNISLVFAAVIAVLWLITLILFYEMKTDNELEQNVVAFEKYMVTFKANADELLAELKDYKDTQVAINPKYACDPDKIK